VLSTKARVEDFAEDENEEDAKPAKGFGQDAYAMSGRVRLNTLLKPVTTASISDIGNKAARLEGVRSSWRRLMSTDRLGHWARVPFE